MKALLVGNGMTSNLIKAYRDEEMILKFISKNESLYNEINDSLTPYRNAYEESRQAVFNRLDEMYVQNGLLTKPFLDYNILVELMKIESNKLDFGIAESYFMTYNIISELTKPKITAIETLLKVNSLFGEKNRDEIKRIANEIYYNQGDNGIEAVTSDSSPINFQLDKKKFAEYINSFDLIFTTNYDNILDNVYNKEVYHLHGGFYFKKIITDGGSVYVTKEKEPLIYKEAHLIWGAEGAEKMNDTLGGYTYPYTYPKIYGHSILEDYFNTLEQDEIDELHIFGYSGLNDGHINIKIANNRNIKKIFYYTDPTTINKQKQVEIEKLFTVVGTVEVKVESWEKVWSELQ